jgi:hypothetical protein
MDDPRWLEVPTEGREEGEMTTLEEAQAAKTEARSKLLKAWRLLRRAEAQHCKTEEIISSVLRADLEYRGARRVYWRADRAVCI